MCMRRAACNPSLDSCPRLRSLYIECVDGSGTLEWNTVSNTLVAFHQDTVGQATASPANDRIFVVDGDESIVHVLVPGCEPQCCSCPACLDATEAAVCCVCSDALFCS